MSTALFSLLFPKLALTISMRRLSSGFPFPLPWYYIPGNVYLIVRLLVTVIFNPRVRDIASHRKSHGIPKKQAFLKHVPYLCPALPEIEFPYVIPSNVTCCGPILLAVKSVSESDMELANWLRKRPTLLLNLGSHIVSSAVSVRELASGLRVVLDRFPHIQVLWKLKSGRHTNDSISEILARELTSGQIRVVKWLMVDPLAILQSGHVICSVHHGGANSFYEATAYVLHRHRRLHIYNAIFTLGLAFPRLSYQYGWIRMTLQSAQSGWALGSMGTAALRRK